MSDEINDIIKRLRERGIFYVRFYSENRHATKWRARAIRNRGATTVNISAEFESEEPVEVAYALEAAVEKEALDYLNQLDNNERNI